jgi:hypothetical protein
MVKDTNVWLSTNLTRYVNKSRWSIYYEVILIINLASETSHVFKSYWWANLTKFDLEKPCDRRKYHYIYILVQSAWKKAFKSVPQHCKSKGKGKNTCNNYSTLLKRPEISGLWGRRHCAVLFIPFFFVFFSFCSFFHRNFSPFFSSFHGNSSPPKKNKRVQQAHPVKRVYCASIY